MHQHGSTGTSENAIQQIQMVSCNVQLSVLSRRERQIYYFTNDFNAVKIAAAPKCYAENEVCRQPGSRWHGRQL